MSLALSFELRLEERSPSRVVVSVLLAPDGEPQVRIDGVALQLVSARGEPLGVQMVLPIAGELRHPMLSTVELKLEDEIPQGSRVHGTAWRGGIEREASLPTDPFTELEVHMRARRRIAVGSEALELERVSFDERQLLAHDFPWIDDPLLPEEPPALTIMDSEDTGPDVVEDVVDGLGLDPDAAKWLKELLLEDDALQE